MLGLVIGTRPDIIKMAPLIRRFPDGMVVHTGQHYSPALDEQLRREYGIEVGLRIEIDQSHGVAENYARMSRFPLADAGITALAVYGDTLSASALALAAVKENIPVMHLEAGLRSRNLSMPEEVARIMIDAASDLLLAPTKTQAVNLLAENVSGEVHVVGNLVQDVLEPWRAHKRTPSGYALLTMHRRENLQNLEALLDAAVEAVADLGLKLLFPAHPFIRDRVLARVARYCDFVELCDPMGHHDFLDCLLNCDVAITDSGGLQEECALLGVPCVTLRTSTERPETVESGWNVLWHPEISSVELTPVVRKHIEETRDLEKFSYCNGSVAEQCEKYIRRFTGHL